MSPIFILSAILGHTVRFRIPRGDIVHGSSQFMHWATIWAKVELLH